MLTLVESTISGNTASDVGGAHREVGAQPGAGTVGRPPRLGYASGVSSRSRRDEIGADIVVSGDESWAKISQRVTVLRVN